MRIDLQTMNGHEIECFLTELLQKTGFTVSGTPLNKVQGIGLIAYSQEPFYRGKYLINYSCNVASVDEKEVDDLIIDVLNNNANKGILITNSCFTQQAKELAESKNIELIDGNELNEITERHFNFENKSLTKANSIRINYFIKYSEFEIDKYNYLRQLTEKDKKNLEAYLELFNFIYSYIANKNFKIMYSGLIYECIDLTKEILKKFANKTKKGSEINRMFTTVQGVLYMLLGHIDESFEVLHKLKRIEFNLCNFTYNLVNNKFYFRPEHYRTSASGMFAKEKYLDSVLDEGCLIYKANLLTILMQLDDSYNSNWLFQQYMNYYENVKSKADNEVDQFSRGVSLNDIASKNYPLVLEQIEKVISKNEQKIYIPAKLGLEYEYSGLTYSLDSFVSVDDIKPYWTELNYDAQKDKIKLIFSLNN